MRYQVRMPATSAARLAEIASRHPELRRAVAQHPNATDGLLDWLAEHGDEATKAIVAYRRAFATLPPPVPG